MIRTAIIDLAIGRVVNIIEFADAPSESPPAGQLWVASAAAEIGDAWDGTSIVQEHAAVSRAGEIAIARANIKALRDRLRFDGGVKVGNLWFLSTAIATSEYNSLALISAGLPDNTVLRAGWRTMDGTTVDMTPALVRQILLAGFAAVAAIDDVAQAHKAAMEAAADPASYDFSAGWPAIYEA